jgi:putative transposase
MKQRLSEAQIRGFLRDAAAGMPVMDLCWNHCFSRATFRAWQSKYGAAIDTDIGRLKQLELENARLRNALARANPDVERLRRVPRSGNGGGDSPKFDNPVVAQELQRNGV